MSTNPSLIRKDLRHAATVAVLALSLPSLSWAATDCFLKIDGTNGDSKDDQHRGEIDLKSYAWSENMSAAPSGASAAAVVSCRDLRTNSICR